MSWYVYSTSLSIRTHDEHDRVNKERVRELNAKFVEMEKEFVDMNLVIIEFDEEDFFSLDISDKGGNT